MRIKEVVKERGLTMQEVARKMGVKPPTLSRAINGNPTIGTLQKIADVLEVKVSDLVEKPKPANVQVCPHCGGELYARVSISKHYRRKQNSTANK
jgi:transcriptional regulator with XRE-family HTH domain